MIPDGILYYINSHFDVCTVTINLPDELEVNRTVDCILLIELENAIEDAVIINGSLTQETAAQAVARVLGYSRTGTKITKVINTAITISIKQNMIVLKNGKLLIKE